VEHGGLANRDVCFGGIELGADLEAGLATKGGTMIDSNQNEFAGAMPISESPANWSWLIERVPLRRLKDLDNWLDDQLQELEAGYVEWVTPKSRQLALRSELRDSRN
jgi:hypothetical protein